MGTHYNQLQNNERDELAALLSQGLSCRKIGKALGRSHTSISREIRRNSDNGMYRAMAAAQASKERSSRSNSYERLRKPGLQFHVREQLGEGWSPEQISGALKENSAKRLIGAMLAETHEIWSTGKKYFDMQEYFEWKKSQPQADEAKVRSIK